MSYSATQRLHRQGHAVLARVCPAVERPQVLIYQDGVNAGREGAIRCQVPGDRALDIVARDGDCWAFVEVKTRRGSRSELPEDGLTPSKVERLVELAETYLAEHDLENVDWRIDLVAIELDSRDGVRRLNVIPGVGVD